MSTRTYLWLTLLSVGMAFLESAVVVYIRAIYYPEGFAFPLKEMAPDLALTELLREIATMVMLVSMAALVARRFVVGVAWFIYAFAVWDLFYYVFLYALLGWPPSLMTWDILFLLPVMWTGPVLAPAINSLTMILLAAVIIRISEKQEKVRIRAVEWILLLGGAVVTIIGYTRDYTLFMLEKFSFSELITFSNYQEILAYSSEYVPVSFDWRPFIIGEVMFLLATGMFYFRNTIKQTDLRRRR